VYRRRHLRWKCRISQYNTFPSVMFHPSLVFVAPCLLLYGHDYVIFVPSQIPPRICSFLFVHVWPQTLIGESLSLKPAEIHRFSQNSVVERSFWALCEREAGWIVVTPTKGFLGNLVSHSGALCFYLLISEISANIWPCSPTITVTLQLHILQQDPSSILSPAVVTMTYSFTVSIFTALNERIVGVGRLQLVSSGFSAQQAE
jgi:hypothetical protein